MKKILSVLLVAVWTATKAVIKFYFRIYVTLFRVTYESYCGSVIPAHMYYGAPVSWGVKCAGAVTATATCGLAVAADATLVTNLVTNPVLGLAHCWFFWQWAVGDWLLKLVLRKASF